MTAKRGVTATLIKRISELESELGVSRYECKFLQKRLDAIRATKDRLVYLLDTPTIQEHLEATGPDATVLDAPSLGKRIG